MTHPTQIKKHERRCIAWNNDNPVGCDVLLAHDNGQQIATKTRSEAYVCNSGYPVIFLEGVSGYYLLDRVRRAQPKQAADDMSEDENARRAP